MRVHKLKCLIFNAQSVRSKKSEIFEFLLSESIDLALFSETYLKHEDSFCHSAYYTYRLDRDNDRGRGGGVAIMIKREIEHILLPCPATEIIEALSIQLINGNSRINVSSIYFPPSKNTDDLRKFENDLKLLTASPNSVAGGDFNSRHYSWNCVRGNPAGNVLFQVLQKYDLMVHFPDSPTHFPHSASKSPSTIDMIISKGVTGLNDFATDDCFTSDHVAVTFTLELDGVRLSQPTTLIKDYSKANWQGYGNYIDRSIPELISELKDEQLLNVKERIDVAIDKFSKLISKADEKFVPTKTITLHAQPPLPPDVLALIGLRRSKIRAYRRNRDVSLKPEIGLLTTRIDIRIKEFTNETFERNLKKIDKDPGPFRKKFWKISRTLRYRKKTIPALKWNGERLITNAQKSETLADHFLAIHDETDPTLGTDSTSRKIRASLCELNIAPTDPRTVQKTSTSSLSSIIASLKTTKASGADGIGNRHIKKLPLRAIDFLALIFNMCLIVGYFPEKWKCGKILPCCKPGKSPAQIESYRPISLLSCLSKLFERVILNQLNDYMDTSEIVPKQQYGFTKGKSCVHQLYRIKKKIKASLSNRKSIGMLSLDLKAAFDSVWHEALIYKMVSAQIPSYLTKIVKSYLSNRSFTVSVGKAQSEKRFIRVGLPQGGVLPPTLFKIFLNDIPQTESSMLALLADDTAYLAESHSTKALINKLQKAADSASRYFKKWRIRVNETKTEALIFTRKRALRHSPQSSVKVNGADVAWKDYLKYLGMQLDRRLTHGHHVNFLIGKSEKALRALYPLINRKSKISTQNKLILFKSIFRPIFSYASPVWGNCAATHIKKIQLHQNKILKMMLNLPRRTPTSVLHEIAAIESFSDYAARMQLSFERNCLFNQNPDIVSLINS